MKRIKKFLIVLLTASAVMISGCGNETILEEYSFGYTQLKAGNSEVYAMTPFQLGEAQQSDGSTMYGANDAHWQITAVSRPSSEITVQQWAEQPISQLEQTLSISDLEKKISETTVLDKPATAVECTFDLDVHGRKVKMAGRSLFFEDNGQVWDITYLYNPADPTGKEVVDHVFGQIK